MSMNILKAHPVLIICLLGLVAGGLALFVFKLPVGSVLTYGFILACPLLHILMMKGGNHKH